MSRPIDHVFPFDKQVLVAANSGEPIGTRSIGFGFGGFLRPLRGLVDDVASLNRNSEIPPVEDDAVNSQVANLRPENAG